jgi:amidohydrolase
MKSILSFLLLAGISCSLGLAQSKLANQVATLAAATEGKVIAWRRHIHEHPELSNREVETAAMVADHLRSLGIEVQTGVAHTGVVGLLTGGKPGPVVALRADMDGLPVVERVEVPFASKVRATYNGQEVGVMHACGHDSHVAILMGVAETLAAVRKDLKGTVKFIFQPAEEGAPEGEEGGAELMVKEGVLDNPRVDAIFGLHINSQTEAGSITYRPGGTMASADFFRIKVKGKQTHGARPWSGADPIVVSSQIIMGLQTIVSRQVALTENAAVVTIGSIHGGVRHNIIPEEVEMTGTIRALDSEMQADIHDRIRRTATKIAEASGTTAEVTIGPGIPVTYNDPALTAQMLPSLQQVAGPEKVSEIKARTGAEDFSFYQKEVPGFFFFLGGMPLGMKPEEAAPHHTPDFFLDESGFGLGVQALCRLTLDYMDNFAK